MNQMVMLRIRKLFHMVMATGATAAALCPGMVEAGGQHKARTQAAYLVPASSVSYSAVPSQAVSAQSYAVPVVAQSYSVVPKRAFAVRSYAVPVMAQTYAVAPAAAATYAYSVPVASYSLVMPAAAAAAAVDSQAVQEAQSLAAQHPALAQRLGDGKLLVALKGMLKNFVSANKGLFDPNNPGRSQWLTFIKGLAQQFLMAYIGGDVGKVDIAGDIDKLLVLVLKEGLGGSAPAPSLGGGGASSPITSGNYRVIIEIPSANVIISPVAGGAAPGAATGASTGDPAKPGIIPNPNLAVPSAAPPSTKPPEPPAAPK